MKRAELLRFDGAVEHDPAIAAWFRKKEGPLGEMAAKWWAVMRGCGDEVRELFHDGCPVVCFDDYPFAYVNAFTAHVNVGFYQGASLQDPARLLQGSGKRMLHVKLRPGQVVDEMALRQLLADAYEGIRTAVENG